MLNAIFHASAARPQLVAVMRSVRESVEKRLTRSTQNDYSQPVAKKEATGFGDSTTHSGHTAQSGFFTSVQPWHSFNGGLGGDTFGYAGGCVCRFANPIQFRLPHLAMRGGLTAHTGGHHG
jgi:hypothetical protein